MCPPLAAEYLNTALPVSFAKLNYAINRVMTNLFPTGLHDFFQVLNVSNVMMVNKL